MFHQPRRYVREHVRSRVWEAWKQGLTISEIARLLPTRKIFTVDSIVRAHGGIRPPPRRRSMHALSGPERELIGQGLAAGCSMREIARHLKRAPSTISREVKRHGGPLEYSGLLADERAWRRARRPKRCLLEQHVILRDLVITKLSLDWSPQQISGWLRKSYPNDAAMRP
jgi:Helix-turn-helix domain